MRKKCYWPPNIGGVGKKSEISTAAPPGGQTVGRRAFDPLTFICANYLGIDWCKPRPCNWSGKKYKKYFPRVGSPKKIDTIFTKMAAVLLFMSNESCHFRAATAHARAIKQWRPFAASCSVIHAMSIWKMLVLRKKFIIVPLVFHSAESIRRRAVI